MTSQTMAATWQPLSGQGAIARWVLGLVILTADLTAAVMLVVQHMGGLELPGCGPTSGCAQLAASRWGSVLGWPVSFLGAAYFAALIVAWLWIGHREGLSRWFRRGVSLGAMGSVSFVGIMFVEGHFCPYCLVVHAGNLAFWGLVQSGRRVPEGSILGPALVGVLMFSTVSAVLGAWQGRFKDEAALRTERRFQESLRRIVEHVRSRPAMPGDPPGQGGLTGRFRRGPEKAAIRVVVFSDYQCKDCQEVEQQLAEVLAARTDVSLVAKHYPLCKDCNRAIKYAHFHDQACRAARAAEAAGLLGGNQGFWRMHAWLFDRKAEFTDAELAAALPRLGFPDETRFLAAASGPETLKRVREDVEEAIGLGITGTPMVFVNGVELLGPEARRAIPRAVAAVSLEKPVPQTAGADQPRPGPDRLVQQWVDAERFELPDRQARWTLGPAGAKHRVVMTLCHQNEYSPQFSRAVRETVVRRGDVRLEFWHFPLSKQFNPACEKMKKERYPDSDTMARIAEAAGRLGGNEAFWKMHDWLLAHQNDFSTDAALAAATGFGLDRGKLAAEIESQAVREAINADVDRAVAAGLKWAPHLYIAGRPIPEMEPTGDVLDRILEQASAARSP